MSKENNKMQVDIENLFKQNELDLCSIKELYRKLAETEEKLTQIKYIDNTLVKKLKKEILDENIQSQLNDKIKEIKTLINNNVNEINSQMDNITARIDGLELSGNLVLRDVIDGEIFTLDNNTTNDEKPSNIPVQSVSLPTTHTLKVDETLQLTPIITPPAATNQRVNWSTNNGNCTVVDGLVTAIAEGECIITCTTVDQNKTAECTITVKAETGTVNFTNLLVNSDTFVIPSGYSTYWMKYKLNNVVNPSGTIALTANTEGVNGSFKLNFANYYQSNGVNPLDSTHVIYFKYKKSTDGSNYSLVSNYYESGNVYHPATKSITIMNETIPYGSTYYFKDFIMIDLTEIYGSGNEPTKTECDTTFSNLWHT